MPAGHAQAPLERSLCVNGCVTSMYCSSLQYARPWDASLLACSHSARSEGEPGGRVRVEGEGDREEAETMRL